MSPSEYIDIRRRCENKQYCFESEDYLCDCCDLIFRPYYTLREFSDIVKNSDRLIHITGNYINKKTPIEYRCDMCGEIGYGLPMDLLKGMCFCKRCTRTRGERMVAKFLIEHGIEFEEQKIFNGCKDKAALRFDFYIPSKNIAIEYDGIQHFQPQSFGSRSKAQKFRYIRLHDKMKNEFCANNNIELIRIKYNEDVFSLLENHLCNGNNFR